MGERGREVGKIWLGVVCVGVNVCVCICMGVGVEREAPQAHLHTLVPLVSDGSAI